MRIGCLQFAPQLGDVDNNLNRADSVLSKANPKDLDLLVLPELAFSGMSSHVFLRLFMIFCNVSILERSEDSTAAGFELKSVSLPPYRMVACAAHVLA